MCTCAIFSITLYLVVFCIHFQQVLFQVLLPYQHYFILLPILQRANCELISLFKQISTFNWWFDKLPCPSSDLVLFDDKPGKFGGLVQDKLVLTFDGIYFQGIGQRMISVILFSRAKAKRLVKQILE